MRPAVTAPSTHSGLLIVNADDLGITAEVTDAILRCHAAGAVTSSTAMVFMDDSARAARLAAGASIPVGLHLNLNEPFSGVGIPPQVRKRQARLASHLKRPSWRWWIYQPRIQRVVDACITDQLTQFRVAYGAEPTHLDGHQHVHTLPNVLASRALPTGMRMRPTFTYARGEKSARNRLVRSAVNAAIDLRFVRPRHLFSVREPGSDRCIGMTPAMLERARVASVEVMTHPGWSDEHDLLLSVPWLEAMASRRVGSYRDL